MAAALGRSADPWQDSPMRRITIGYLDSFKPFAYFEAGGHHGLFLDRLRDVARRREVGLAFRPGRLAALPQSLVDGSIDAIAAKAVTPERSEALSFSSPLLSTAAALFGPPGHPAPAIAAVGTARIVTPAAGPLKPLIARLAPHAQLATVDDYQQALDAVFDGLADWAALNVDVAAQLAPTASRGPAFAELDLALAVLPGDPKGVLARLWLDMS